MARTTSLFHPTWHLHQQCNPEASGRHQGGSKDALSDKKDNTCHQSLSAM
ncbi:hypothetical protein Hdeb2414_s0016g00482751 [Helianthus debilis subsp. tardiflorus]